MKSRRKLGSTIAKQRNNTLGRVVCSKSAAGHRHFRLEFDSFAPSKISSEIPAVDWGDLLSMVVGLLL